ncbi:hypothetical protein [Acidovorax sp. LjRoot194]|uniref:hypothetical protein n=1 Tax=Acidovorax sp. LjRoot194 TaxID=3342280 RepID=UPI003ECFC2D4
MTAPTADAMRAALQSISRLPACREWPADYDAVMADPVRMRLVRLQATFLTRVAAEKAAARSPPQASQLNKRPPCFDHKRAAAGDRDD